MHLPLDTASSTSVYETKKDRCRSRLPQFPSTGFYQRAKKREPKYPEPIQLGPSLPFPQTHHNSFQPKDKLIKNKLKKKHHLQHLHITHRISPFIPLPPITNHQSPIIQHPPTHTSSRHTSSIIRHWSSIEASNSHQEHRSLLNQSLLPLLPFTNTRSLAVNLSSIAARPSPQLYFSIWSFHPTHNRLLTQI